MKNLMFAFLLFSASFVFAGEDTKLETYIPEIEYKTVANESGVNTCYARICWNPTETTRECTEWQEVPCNTELTVDGKSEPEDRN